jgi:hypothetical protein
MKTIILSLIIILTYGWTKVNAQIQKDTIPVIDLSGLDFEIHCLVAHCTDDGVFGCDYKGTYYPSHIYDTAIKKWFIKMVNCDSLFYYRTDYERVYIWNGSGYEWKWSDSGSSTIFYPYKGYDTLRIWEQVWRPKK